MLIRSIEVWNFCPVFRDGPYAMSHVVQHESHGRILRVHTSGEVCGLGEIVFYSSVSEPQRNSIIEREDDYLGSLVGKDVGTLAVVAEQLRTEGKATRGVAYALETALLDIKARVKGQSMAELLGGALGESVDDYFSVSERSVERVRQRVVLAGPNRSVIQLKLGVGTREDDVKHITTALEVMNRNQLLLADANGGWTVEGACEVIAAFDDERIFWEEPCNNYEDNVLVARASTRPVMFDQCISDASLAVRAVEEGVASAVCIKPGFLGGLSIGRDIRDRCVRAGVKMRIDGPWCGDIASAANLQLAIGAPPDLLIAGCDLREPLVIERDLHGVRRIGEARIAPPAGPGLGIELDDKLGPPDRVFSVV